MLRPDDPYNQGIGTLDLGDMNLGNMNVGNVGQVPVNNMQVAEAINYGVLPQSKEKFEASYPLGYSKSSNFGGNTYTGTTKGDLFNAIQEGTFGMKTEDMFNKNITDLFKGVADEEIGTGMFFDAKPTWERTGTEVDYKGYIDVPKKDLGKDLLKTLPEGFWKDDDQASLDADFYNEYGYPKTAMINPLSIIGMVKAGLSKKEIAKVLIKNKLQKEIGKKVKPVLTGILTDGKAAAAAPTSHAEARSTGGDYHSGHESTVGGQTTDWGSESAMIARGGLAQYAPRGSYFDGGLASLWLR